MPRKLKAGDIVVCVNPSPDAELYGIKLGVRYTVERVHTHDNFVVILGADFYDWRFKLLSEIRFEKGDIVECINDDGLDSEKFGHIRKGCQYEVQDFDGTEVRLKNHKICGYSYYVKERFKLIKSAKEIGMVTKVTVGPACETEQFSWDQMCCKDGLYVGAGKGHENCYFVVQNGRVLYIQPTYNTIEIPGPIWKSYVFKRYTGSITVCFES